jgi:hypothetical protein
MHVSRRPLLGLPLVLSVLVLGGGVALAAFSTTTGLPAAWQRSQAALKRSGERIVSRKASTTPVSGSAAKKSIRSAASTTASLPDEMT